MKIAAFIAACVLSVAALAAAVPDPPGSVALNAAIVAQRPAYNTGNGFFVLNGRLYDPSGHLFMMEGVDRAHYDSDSATGIVNSHANTVRIFISTEFGKTVPQLAAIVQGDHTAHNEVAIPTLPDANDATGKDTGTSCSTDPAVLASAVQIWVTNATTWLPLQQNLLFNIANEWGPTDSTIWRDSYIAAVQAMRTAGYTAPLVIDAGGCGQDEQGLVDYSAAILAADPQRNLMFSFHAYGSTDDLTAPVQSIKNGNPTVVTLSSSSPTHPFDPTWNGTGNSYNGISKYYITGVTGETQINGISLPSGTNAYGVPGAWTIQLNIDSSKWGNYTGGGTVVDSNNYQRRMSQLAALAASTGAAYIVGEFGPGRNIGPSPTMLTPGELITAANQSGIGWIAWAWDDNDAAGCTSDDKWFAMQYGCGEYTKASDLTTFGTDVVLNPVYGLAATSKMRH